MSARKEIQAQYDGFLSTPLLWKNGDVDGLGQFSIITNQSLIFNKEVSDKLRLGKRVELFLSHLLNNDSRFNSISENIQIQQEKITLGELDFIFKLKEQQVHLEAVFKFYLLDVSVSNSEIEQWVGPNRKDSLNLKIEKLKNRQLPRLRLEETSKILQKKGFDVKEMRQYVHFQAQLFIPYGTQPVFKILNKDCIEGFYIFVNQLDQFQNCQFYIPSKTNWLANPTHDKKYVDFLDFKRDILLLLNEQRSPLCWMKDENNLLTKLFVVWW